MFSRARFRLTAWFVVVMAAFVVVLGGAVYYVVQEQLRNQVDDGVRTTAKRVGHVTSTATTSTAIMAGQSLPISTTSPIATSASSPTAACISCSWCRRHTAPA